MADDSVQHAPSAPDDPVVRTALWLLAALGTGLWLAVFAGSDRLPAADGSHMLAQCLRLAHDIHAGELSQSLGRVATLAAPHPPVGYLPTLVLSVLGLPMLAVIALGDLFWLGLLATGLRRLVPGEGAPLALFVGTSTALCWWSADHYGFDLVAAGVCAQILGWLHASDGLRHAGPRRWFGLWLALGFLTKYSVPLICFVPVVWVCLPALWRRPRALAEAVGLWLLIAVPYYAVNLEAVLGYVGDTLAPPDLPGEFPQEMSASERFGPGQLVMATALKDALGFPLLVALSAGAVAARRAIPGLAVVGGVVVLGLLNEQQGRYVLPMVFLLVAAGAPRPGAWRRWHVGGLVMLGLISLRSTAGTFAAADAASSPTQRRMEHDLGGLLALGDWPAVPEVYRPLSAPLAAWEVNRLLAALEARTQPGELVVLLLDGPPYQPNASMVMMAAERAGLGLDFMTLHARLDGMELVVVDYVGPFPRDRSTTITDPSIPAWTGVRWAWLVARNDGVGAAWTWLNHQPHRIDDRWTLPDGYTGLLVELLENP